MLNAIFTSLGIVWSFYIRLGIVKLLRLYFLTTSKIHS